MRLPRRGRSRGQTFQFTAMSRIRIASAAALLTLTACDGLKEALTAHVDVVARAGSQELSVQRMADLMGKSKIQLNRDVAQSVADVWVGYQLLAKSAANLDSLDDPKLIDEVMWPAYTQQRTQKFYQEVSKRWEPDTSDAALRAEYEKGVLLAASHILLPIPEAQQATGSDSVRRKAEDIRVRATAANFGALAKQHGTDATKDQGGSLGVFQRGRMVPDFEQAVLALKPGEIGPLLRTQFGYHIIRRNTFEEVKDQFKGMYGQAFRGRADSTYLAQLETNGKIEVKANAAKVVKEVAADPAGHEDDGTVVATSSLGNFTAGNVARWLTIFPNLEQMRAQIRQAPDSVMPLFIRNLIRNELLLKAADSAKIDLDSTETQNIRRAFVSLVTNTWAGLGVAPTMLTDSARTPAERERLAAARVDDYMGRLLTQEAQFIEVPGPLTNALHKKYEWKVNAAGIDRALEAAQKIRAVTDSARAAQTPPTAVPMPGGVPADTSRRPPPDQK
jgi:hypothetical protein